MLRPKQHLDTLAETSVELLLLMMGGWSRNAPHHSLTHSDGDYAMQLQTLEVFFMPNGTRHSAEHRIPTCPQKCRRGSGTVLSFARHDPPLVGVQMAPPKLPDPGI